VNDKLLIGSKKIYFFEKLNNCGDGSVKFIFDFDINFRNKINIPKNKKIPPSRYLQNS
jgi:hypothetical protein